MGSSLGSIGPGMAARANVAIDQPEAGMAEPPPEHAAGVLATLKAAPARAERQRMADEQATPADDEAAADDDRPPPSSDPTLETATAAPPMAGMFERAPHAPMHRMPGEGAPISRLDRRRKRRC